MKIGLYLQNKELSQKQYENDMLSVKNSDMDLLVFPENCITGFSEQVNELDICDDNDFNWIIDTCTDFASSLGKAIVFSGIEKEGAIFSLFVNPFASDEETHYQLYVKHTATECSSFVFYNYSEEWIQDQFTPIVMCGHKIGLTICYDCNHAAFSRMWAKNGIDILINSTGGNVDYYKWYRYNKVRAMENNCINLCTMGYESGQKNSSYTFGFSPSGYPMKYETISKPSAETPCGIFVYDTDNISNNGICDIRFDQSPKENKYTHCSINPYNLPYILSKSKMIENNLYISETIDRTLIYIVVNGDEIEKPEKLLKKMYSPELARYKNKRYIVLNIWENFDRIHFENVISDTLRVRSMENYCAVIFSAPNVKKCYQTTQNKGSQIIPLTSDGYFALDLDRCKGPEVVWRNTWDSWRKGYEKLISKL